MVCCVIDKVRGGSAREEVWDVDSIEKDCQTARLVPARVFEASPKVASSVDCPAANPFPASSPVGRHPLFPRSV